MKLVVLCPTFRRPKLLGYLIRCFERQTHPDRELVILDDAGTLRPQTGDLWRVLSQPNRFPTLGAKRNALARLAPSDCGGLGFWGDQVYGFTRDNEYLLIDVGTAAATLVEQYADIEFWGAGTTTVPYVEVE